MNYANLIQNITENIKTNGSQAITAQVLQDVLVDMVGELGQSGALLGGVIDTSFVPDLTNDAQVVYIAESPGTYTNFNGLVVGAGEVAFFYFNGNAWAKSSVDVLEVVNNLNSTATDKALSAAMGKQIGDNISQLGQKIGSVNNSTEGITITDDAFVSAINGGIVENTTRFPSAVTDIPILGGMKIRLNIEDVPIASGRGAAFYDANGGFISGIIYVIDVLTYEVVTPEKATKMALTIFGNGKFLVEYLDSITKKIQDNVDGIAKNTNDIQDIKLNIGETFNKSYSELTIIDKASINCFTGAITDPDYTNSPNAVQGIPVIGGSSITIHIDSALSASGRGFAFYDADNNYISGIPLVVGTTDYTAVVPNNATSLSITTFGDDDFCVTRKSPLPLAFATFAKELAKQSLKPNIDLTDATFVTGKFISGAYKSIATHSDYGYYRLDVANGTKLKINAGFTHTQIGLAFYNESNKPISGYAYTNEEINVVAPAECAYILFTKKLSLPINVEVDYRQATDLLKIFDSYQLKRDATNPLSKVNEMPTFVRMFRKIGCIGDSLTMGGFDTTTPNSNGANIPDFSYPAQLAKFTGVDVKNFGISGATASEQYAYNWLAIAQGGTIFPYTDFSQNPADAYIIALGTNDISQLSEFTGNVETDIDLQDYNNNANTSVGGYAKIIQIIKEMQPKAEIFCVTISKYRANPASPKIEANEKIVSIATLLGCWVIDLYTYGEDNHDEFEQYYVNDSHYNAMGCNLRARQYATYIDWIVANNMQHFRNVQFIGTNYSYDG